MDTDSLQFRGRVLLAQRNALLAFSALLSTAVVGLTVVILTRSERIVLVPSCFERQAWVSDSTVSRDYLEQWAGFVAQLVLTKSCEDFEDKARLLIKHIHPSFVSQLINELDAEAKAMVRERGSYSFEPQSIQALGRERVELEGWMVCRVEGREISRRRERYNMRFQVELGRPLLVEMEGGVCES